MILRTDQTDDGLAMLIDLHPQYPARWRQEPYYADIKRWAVAGLKRNPLVMTHVFCGSEHWLVLPDRELHNPKPGVVVPSDNGAFDFVHVGWKGGARKLEAFLNGRSI